MARNRLARWARRVKKGREQHDFKADKHAGHRENRYWTRFR